MRGDSQAIWQYIPANEADRMGMSRQNFQDLLTKYYLPTFQALGSPSAQTVTPYAEISGAVVASRSYRLKDGLEVKAGVTVAPGEDGPMCYGLLSGVISSAMIARNRRASDHFTYYWEQRGLQNDGPILDGMGIKGILYLDQGERVFSTWGERLAIVNHKLAVLESRH